MNKILNKYINNNFKFNKNIIFSVIISICLTITAINMLFIINNTINKTIENNIIKKQGEFQLTLFNVEDVNKYSNYNISLSQNLGYAKFDSKTILNHINLVGIDKNEFNKYPIDLIKGKFPENDNEIAILTDILYSNSNFDIDKTINLNVKQYSFNSYGETKILDQHNGYLANNYIINDLFSKEYKIVGIIKINNNMFGNRSSLGYTAFTTLNKNNDDNNKYNISFFSKDKIDSNKIKDYNKYTHFENDKLINSKYNIIINITKNIITIFVIFIILFCFKLLYDNLNQIYKFDLIKRYLKLYSLGANEETIKYCIYKESGLIFIISNILSILVITIISIVFKIIFSKLNISYSLLGYIFVNIIIAFLIYKIIKDSYNYITSNKYIYDNIRKENTDIILDNSINFKNASLMLGYKGYKAYKNKFKLLINSITFLLINFIVLYEIKGYFELNYNKQLDENKPNIIISYDNNSNINNENKYKELLEISNNPNILRFNIIKSFSFTNNKNKMFNIVSISNEEYNRYINELNISNLDGLIWYNKDSNNNLINENINIDKKISYITDKKPFGVENYINNNGLLITNEENINNYDYTLNNMYIYSKNYDELVKDIKSKYSTLKIYNLEGEYENFKYINNILSSCLNIIILFIVSIGVISGINAIFVTLNLRKKEFNTLNNLGARRSIFHKMFLIQNILTLLKGIIIGIVVGIILTFIIFKIINFIINYPLIINFKLICYLIIFIILLVQITTLIIFNKINKDNY